mmetsp:Transcript_20403/g.60718  ORF Transcript_20403/g.60718 Transcript_20403/m.60718 type:complete len:85 (+) Transcript_20403:738-992(+)|eukprot:359106-Chlamydomonas_euryale.AAC.2
MDVFVDAIVSIKMAMNASPQQPVETWPGYRHTSVVKRMRAISENIQAALLAAQHVADAHVNGNVRAATLALAHSKLFLHVTRNM